MYSPTARWNMLLFSSLLLNVCTLLNYLSRPEVMEMVKNSAAEYSCPKCPTCEKQSQSNQISETTNVLGCSNETLKWDTVGQPGNQFGCYINQLLQWIQSLKTMEKPGFAQHGEDGITEAIFKKIGEGTKYYVEFGVQNAVQCNTRFLREKYNWTGLMMDSGYYIPEINLQKESVWIDNVADLFKKHKVPIKFDYLSVDTDFSDFWLTKSILEAGYKPRVIISEINRNHGAHGSLTVPSASAKAHGMFPYTRFYGTSALALAKLVSKFGYQLVYIEKSSTNIFFIHKSDLHNTDLALAHWIKVISEGTEIGKADHPVQHPSNAHSHICIDMPCISSFDW